MTLRRIGRFGPQVGELGVSALGRRASAAGRGAGTAQNAVAATGQKRPLAARRRRCEPGIARASNLDGSAARRLQNAGGKTATRCTRPGGPPRRRGSEWERAVGEVLRFDRSPRRRRRRHRPFDGCGLWSLSSTF